MNIYKKYCLKFQKIQSIFFNFFLSSIYKMVGSMDIFKSLSFYKALYPKMSKFVPDHLKTKIMCKYSVKKLPYLLVYVAE